MSHMVTFLQLVKAFDANIASIVEKLILLYIKWFLFVFSDWQR